MEKKIVGFSVLLLSSVLCAVLLSACSGNRETAERTSETATSEAAESTERMENAVQEEGNLREASEPGKDSFPEEIAELPVLITSAGQSMDMRVAEILLEKEEIPCKAEEHLTAEELEDCRTLLVVLGGSAKGLASAGISEEEELDRVRGLIAAAEEKNMTVIALHIGGSSRRGEVSDRFIPDALKAADAAVILAEGDSDGMMRRIVEEAGVPTVYIEKQTEAMEPLHKLFKK